MRANVSTGRYDPSRLVRLQAVRGLFIDNKVVEVGQVFEVQACEAGAVISTGRAKLASEADRPLVYKSVHHG